MRSSHSKRTACHRAQLETAAPAFAGGANSFYSSSPCPGLPCRTSRCHATTRRPLRSAADLNGLLLQVTARIGSADSPAAHPTLSSRPDGRAIRRIPPPGGPHMRTSIAVKSILLGTGHRVTPRGTGRADDGAATEDTSRAISSSASVSTSTRRGNTVCPQCAPSRRDWAGRDGTGRDQTGWDLGGVSEGWRARSRHAWFLFSTLRRVRIPLAVL
jgi:hypothetical protein